MFPFLVPPFCDRSCYWKLMINHAPRPKIRGILEADNSILPMFGYKMTDINQVMCRPADIVETILPDGFICRDFDMNREAEAIGNTILKGYSEGIDSEIYGEETLESAIEDAQRVLMIYSPNNLSHLIVDEAEDQIAGIGLAGVGESYTHGYAEIADICVLPQYRGRGLAKYMIGRIVSQSYGVAPFVKLFVSVGNNAEYVYRQMGFIAGPRFANMELRAKQ